MPVGQLIIRDLLGVNLNSEDVDLKDTELCWSKNLYEARQREYVSRLNSRVVLQVKNANQHLSFFTRCVDLHFFAREGGASGFAYIKAGGEFGRILYWLAPYSTLEAPLHYVLTNLDANTVLDRPSYITHLNKTYIFDGVKRGRYFTHGVAGLTELAEVAGFAPNTCVKYRGQFIYAQSTGNMLRYSEIELPETLVADTKSLPVGDSAERIVALVEVTIEGGDQYLEPYLLILKSNSIWMLQGDPPTEADLGTLRLFPIITGEGCVGKGTVVKTPHGVVWCSGKNVFIAPPGGKPIRIGNSLKPLLKALDQNNAFSWHAEFFDGVYRLTVPQCSYPEDFEYSYMPGEGGGGEPVDVQLSHQKNEQWWLNLDNFSEARGGADDAVPYKWWGPMTVSSDSMSVLPGYITAPERLFSVLRSTSVQTQDGLPFAPEPTTSSFVIEQLDVVTADGFDHTAALGDHGRTQLSIEMRFKAFDFGEQNTRKLLQGIETSYAYGGLELPEVSVSTGVANTVMPESSSTSAAGFILGSSLLGSTVLGTGVLSVGHRPVDGKRLTGFTLQPTFKLISALRCAFRSLTLRIRPIASRPR